MTNSLGEILEQLDRLGIQWLEFRLAAIGMVDMEVNAGKKDNICKPPSHCFHGALGFFFNYVAI